LLAGASLSTTGNFTNAGVLTSMPSRTLNTVLTVNGNFTETSGGSLAVQLGGTTSSPTFGSLTVTGAVSLGGGLTVTSTVVPAVGSSFEILDKLSGSAISGTFTGLPEGSTFTVQVGTTTMMFQITYVGGNGNDVVIRRTAGAIAPRHPFSCLRRTFRNRELGQILARTALARIIQRLWNGRASVCV
jgi:hypothetical protein